MLSGVPMALKALTRGKMTLKTAVLHPHIAPAAVKRLFDRIEGRQQRNELNLYVFGYGGESEVG
jgi:succinate dehydrogenase iron-sulfur subunit